MWLLYKFESEMNRERMKLNNNSVFCLTIDIYRRNLLAPERFPNHHPRPTAVASGGFFGDLNVEQENKLAGLIKTI